MPSPQFFLDTVLFPTAVVLALWGLFLDRSRREKRLTYVLLLTTALCNLLADRLHYGFFKLIGGVTGGVLCWIGWRDDRKNKAEKKAEKAARRRARTDDAPPAGPGIWPPPIKTDPK